MAITKLERDLNIIYALDNEPNDVGGLTAEELKEKFDESGNAIKQYINESLIPETEQAFDAVYDHVDEVRGNLQEDIDSRATKEELQGILLDQVPDGTITVAKLAPEVIDRSYTKDETVSTETKQSFGLGAEATPNDVFSAIQGYALKAVMGSYVGSGTYGESNPTGITFEVAPKMVIMLGYVNDAGRYVALFGADYSADGSSYYNVMTNYTPTEFATYYGFGCKIPSSGSTNDTRHRGRVTDDGKTYEWYCGNAARQLNELGYTYYYMALI